MINRHDTDSGFSLVELVIAIMIMAIVAAALAPQVMKWVNNARIATDLQTRSSMESFAKYAASDPAAYEEISSRQIKITINEDGCEMRDTSDSPVEFPNYARSLASYAGKTVSNKSGSTGVYIIDDIRLRTSGGEVNVFVTRGAVSSIINEALASDDLSVAVSDIAVPTLYGSQDITGSTTGTLSFTNASGGSVSNPATALKTEHKYVDGYLDNILVVESTDNIADVKIDGVTPPCWVYVGSKSAIAAGDYSGVSLYQWSGEYSSGNPVWKKLPITGLK